jgi:NADPH:quinone reductase-like Zn-dependent oxidoreductase
LRRIRAYNRSPEEENRTMKAEGWFIYQATDRELKKRIPAQLRRETFRIDKLEDNEVLAAPLYGCWEGNMGHAITRKPIDVCRFRGEERAILGNSGVVEIVDVGKDVKTVRPGQKAIIFCVGEEDWFGFPKTIMGYDARGTMGCLATYMKGRDRQFIPIHPKSRHRLEQWAGFSLRYITAWSNWEMALGTYRLSVTAHELASLNVWGWGGGVTLAELDLARRFGMKSVMISGSDRNLETIRSMELVPLDRRKFGNLQFDKKKYKKDKGYTSDYHKAEKSFLEEVVEMTSGRKVQIFIDMIGEPVFHVTLKALGRGGVVTSAGWKEGMTLGLTRAMECIERHQHIHTHYARYSQGWQAVAFAEGNAWIPPKPEKVFSFDDIPQLAEKYGQGDTGLFPTFEINASN